MTPSTVLVLSDDPLVEMVVRHLMPAEQYTVHRCQSADEVSAMLASVGRLAVLDFPTIDEAALHLVRRLHAEGGKPVLVLTGEPDKLTGSVEPAVRVLQRPPQLGQLQAALNAAIAEPTLQPAAVEDSGWRKARRRLVGLVGGALLCVAVVVFLAPYLGIPGAPNLVEWAVAKKEEEKEKPSFPVQLLPGRKDAFELPAEVVSRMNIPTKPYMIPARPQPRVLTLSGTLAFDPDRLTGIQSRFPGELVSLGTADGAPIQEERRSEVSVLAAGMQVKKDAPMAVVWCADLGAKKSDLVDTLVKLSLDRISLQKYQKLMERTAGSEATLRQLENNVSASLNAVNRAERALRTWRVSDEEIHAVKEEAARIIDRNGKRDSAREKSWARVEIRSPIDGVIVEKNVHNKKIVDSTMDLFKVADLSWLAVYAHVYEEDQPELQDLLKKRKGAPLSWRLFLASDPLKRPLPSVGIKRLGMIVDPNQHTNIAVGLVQNPEQRLQPGQFVTAEVEIPAPPGVVSIPVAALDEDGESSHVLVQLEAGRHRYALKRVRVLRRYQDFAYVSSLLSESDRAAGLTELKPGELVVTGGAVQLKSALEEAQARARAQK